MHLYEYELSTLFLFDDSRIFAALRSLLLFVAITSAAGYISLTAQEMEEKYHEASKHSKYDSNEGGTQKPFLSNTKSMSLIIPNNQTTEKVNCLCAPTTHAGSFRCRQHRNPSLKRASKSVGSGLSNLAAKSASTHNRMKAQYHD
ncbi:hypothetical protein MRB53_023101 [Persea americana]|uniref:Uncharacterized protein n=1 Tax=Persea americana TaxID=3435 RepID=A0ACC2L9F1_PERAE|nr:hypothetical protein MRB53_023101 [Persea americana]